MNWEKIIEKVPLPYYEYSKSRSSIWRKKNKIWKARKLYFWIWLSFNIDGNRINQKKIYKKHIETIKQSLTKKELEDIYHWIESKYFKISKNISIDDVNSIWKLFMHSLWILPYVKENFKKWNIEWFIARILYNSTRSWFTNYCKKNKEKSLNE